MSVVGCLGAVFITSLYNFGCIYRLDLNMIGIFTSFVGKSLDEIEMADCGSDVEFSNDKHRAYNENIWRLTLTTILLRRFGTLRPL